LFSNSVFSLAPLVVGPRTHHDFVNSQIHADPVFASLAAFPLTGAHDSREFKAQTRASGKTRGKNSLPRRFRAPSWS
jgi:hypothetical protein